MRRLATIRADLAKVSRVRRVGCTLAVLAVLAPVVLAPPAGLVVAIPAAFMVAVAILPWPLGPVRLATAAVVCGVTSIILYAPLFVPRPSVLFWLMFEVPALVVLTGRVVRRVPDRQVVPVASLTGVAALVAPLRFAVRATPPDWGLAIAAAMLVAIPLGIAAGVGFYLRSLDERRERAVAEARRDQRLELARDLHDFVAHELTGILLEVQAAQVREYEPEENRALLARLEQAGLRALTSMDETLRALRGDGEDGSGLRSAGLDDLPDLVERFRAGGHAHAVLDLDEDLYGVLPRRAERAVFHVVLEALTNIRRHASRATEVQVTVRRRPEAVVEVTVADNGGGRSGRLTGERRGGGTGLIGLNERVTAVGGTLTHGPAEKGWRVTARLPMPDAPPTA